MVKKILVESLLIIWLVRSIHLYPLNFNNDTVNFWLRQECNFPPADFYVGTEPELQKLCGATTNETRILLCDSLMVYSKVICEKENKETAYLVAQAHKVINDSSGGDEVCQSLRMDLNHHVISPKNESEEILQETWQKIKSQDCSMNLCSSEDNLKLCRLLHVAIAALNESSSSPNPHPTSVVLPEQNGGRNSGTSGTGGGKEAPESVNVPEYLATSSQVMPSALPEARKGLKDKTSFPARNVSLAGSKVNPDTGNTNHSFENQLGSIVHVAYNITTNKGKTEGGKIVDTTIQGSSTKHQVVEDKSNITDLQADDPKGQNRGGTVPQVVSSQDQTEGSKTVKTTQANVGNPDQKEGKETVSLAHQVSGSQRQTEGYKKVSPALPYDGNQDHREKDKTSNSLHNDGKQEDNTSIDIQQDGGSQSHTGRDKTVNTFQQGGDNQIHDHTEGYKVQQGEKNQGEVEGNKSVTTVQQNGGNQDQNEKNKAGKNNEVKSFTGDQNQDNFMESESPSSGHFMAYFLTAVVLCVAGYVVFHNKQKIIAFIVEGRNGNGRRSSRRPSSKDYKKLNPSMEEVMPSLEKSTTSTNYIY